MHVVHIGPDHVQVNCGLKMVCRKKNGGGLPTNGRASPKFSLQFTFGLHFTLGCASLVHDPGHRSRIMSLLSKVNSKKFLNQTSQLFLLFTLFNSDEYYFQFFNFFWKKDGNKIIAGNWTFIGLTVDGIENKSTIYVNEDYGWTDPNDANYDGRKVHFDITNFEAMADVFKSTIRIGNNPSPCHSTLKVSEYRKWLNPRVLKLPSKYLLSGQLKFVVRSLP